MKRMKRIAGILLAAVMVLAMSLPVFADGVSPETTTKTSITVNSAQQGETYKLYKMLDLSASQDKNAYSYKLNNDWETFFKEGGAGAAYVTLNPVGETTYVTWKDDQKTAEKMEAFGKAAATFAAGRSAKAEQTADGTTVVFADLAPGYYLITTTNGTLAMVTTTPADPAQVVNEKNANPIIDKKVQEDSTLLYGEENSAQIGDTVNFQVKITLKKGAKSYVLHDQMDKGLGFQKDSIAIAGLTEGTDYTVVSSSDRLSDNCSFEIQFKQTYLDTITADTTLTVTYSALLNKHASLNAGDKNMAQLTWGDKNHTEWDTTTTKHYEFAVLKYASGDEQKTPLAGATFQLEDKAGNVVKLIKITDTRYRVADGTETDAVDSFVTVSGDVIEINGVDLDKYYLREIKAPDGYNLIKDPVEVTINADNAVVAEIANSTGTLLPSTGGMGTNMIYLIGAVCAVGAAVVLFSKRRMRVNG